MAGRDEQSRQSGTDPLASPIRLQLTSDASNLGPARKAVIQSATRCGFSEADADRIALAVDEALANVILHGYEGKGGHPIDLVIQHRCDDGRDGIAICISDDGRQVDPDSIACRDLDDLRPGGLGTHIMRTVMDKVEYEKRTPAGMRVRLTRYLKQEDGGTAEVEYKE